jgi:hypothetical protein
MVHVLPGEININILKYMDFYCLLKSYLYVDGFKDFININTLDSMIEEKLAIYHIGITKKEILKNNKEKLYRFLKYINDNSPYIAYDIANMDDNQYHKFDYLSYNGISHLFADMASDNSHNLNKFQLDKLIEIYKFIEKNCMNELFMCYDTIIKIAQTFNQDQINAFYYLYQNGIKEKIAFDIIITINASNYNNINDIIQLHNDGCPDYLICPILKNITNRQQFIDKIKSGMEPLDAYKFINLLI